MTPLPPAPTGVAHHSLRLAEELATTGQLDLDLFAEQRDGEILNSTAPGDVEVFSARSFPRIESLRGGYDRMLYAFGNSPNHVTALELLRRRPGVVIAHDVKLTNLYYYGSRNPAAVPAGFAGSLRRLYGEELPRGLGEAGQLDTSQEQRYGILMAREVIELAERYLVSSRAARALATLDAGPGAAAKIGVLRFAAELPVPGRSGFDRPDDDSQPSPPAGSPLVVALGTLDPIRQPLRLLEAFASAHELVGEARLAYVGPTHHSLAAEILRHAERRGISGCVVATGQTGTRRFLEWMRSATIAVQLRDSWNGEASSTIGECLVAGLPLVVSDIGWARDLPDNCVVKIDPRTTTKKLGATIASLLRDEGRRAALRAGALAYAPELSFKRAGEALLEELLA